MRLAFWRKREWWEDPKAVALVNAEMADGVIAEIGETLEALGCGHDLKVGDIAPMFYPEWIRCVAAYYRAGCPADQWGETGAK